MHPYGKNISSQRSSELFSSITEEGKEALIYLSYIKKQMSEQNLYKSYTMQELLDDLDVIECFEQPCHALHVGEVTKKQVGLYKSLGIKPPASL